MTATQTPTAVRPVSDLSWADVPFAGMNSRVIAYPRELILMARALVNMDVVDRTRRLVAAAEQRVILEAARKEA